MNTTKQKTPLPKGEQSPPRCGERAKGRVYKTLGLDAFIQKARQVHGDKYDYSESVYVRNRIPLKIICPVHGPFKQRPYVHLCGSGCPECGKSIMQQKLLNKIHNTEYSLPEGAVMDMEGQSQTKCYKVWRNIFRRCGHLRNYIDCKVSNEWLTFSNFKRFWDENYRDGYQIDKDLLCNGHGRVYGPDTCCFLPVQLNLMLRRGRFINSYGSRHYVSCCGNYLGSYDSYEEAISVYRQFKERFVRQRANEYFDKGEISERIYNALINYKVENYE